MEGLAPYLPRRTFHSEDGSFFSSDDFLGVFTQKRIRMAEEDFGFFFMDGRENISSTPEIFLSFQLNPNADIFLMSGFASQCRHGLN